MFERKLYESQRNVTIKIYKQPHKQNEKCCLERNNFFCKRIRRRDAWGGKLAYHEIHKERQKTGGGTPPPDLSEETAHIADMMKDKSSFVGIDHGIDSFNINVETHEEEGSTENYGIVMPTPESSGIVETLERNSQNFEIYQNSSKKLKFSRTCSSKPGSKESMVLNEEAVIRKHVLNLEQNIQKLRHKTQLVKYENVLLENQKLKLELGYFGIL